MAFCFKKKESVPRAIRRLGRERVANALECLKDCPHGEAIHCARKDIKKVRAVLRLVRTGIERKEFRVLTKRLRQAAKYLAAPRDAHVKIETLAHLKSHFKGQLATSAWCHVREELRNAFAEEMNRFAKEKSSKTVQRLLHQVAKGLEGLKIKDKDWKALSPGMKATYVDGLRTYQKARRDSSSENLHAWRKRTKDLWYQITLLRRIWPEQMDKMTDDLAMLGELLGNDHDLVMLRHGVNEICAGERHSRELETLIGLIEERHRELRSAAVAIGARFYAEDPSAFSKRLAGYWKAWRREKSRPPG